MHLVPITDNQLSLSLADVIPTPEEGDKMWGHIENEIQRTLVSKLPAFSHLRDHAFENVPHQYSEALTGATYWVILVVV